VLSHNTAGFSGGAIRNGGTLNIFDSRLEDNLTSASGAILDSGTLTVERTLIAGNRATIGGGLDLSSSSATTTILNSTIANNLGTSEGGGLRINKSGAVNISNTAIVHNQAGSGGIGGGGFSMGLATTTLVNVTMVRNSSTSTDTGSAGGINKVNGTLVVRNTIISENTQAPGGVNDNVVPGDINTSQSNFLGGIPRLGPLQNNGGPVPTMKPGASSPVVDAGSTAAATNAGLTRDARGFERFVDGNLNTAVTVDIGAVEFNPGIEQPIVVGTDAGPEAEVRVFDFAGNLRMDIRPFPGFTGGVRVATGDVNSDGIADIIAAAGPGGGPQVRIFHGATGAEIRSFFAYAPGFGGGVYVASGDTNGDGFAEVIIGVGVGGGPHVRVWDGQTGAERYGFLA
jgi:hypothetical protein